MKSHTHIDQRIRKCIHILLFSLHKYIIEMAIDLTTLENRCLLYLFPERPLHQNGFFLCTNYFLASKVNIMQKTIENKGYEWFEGKLNIYHIVSIF